MIEIKTRGLKWRKVVWKWRRCQTRFLLTLSLKEWKCISLFCFIAFHPSTHESLSDFLWEKPRGVEKTQRRIYLFMHERWVFNVSTRRRHDAKMIFCRLNPFTATWKCIFAKQSILSLSAPSLRLSQLPRQLFPRKFLPFNVADGTKCLRFFLLLRIHVNRAG